MYKYKDWCKIYEQSKFKTQELLSQLKAFSKETAERTLNDLISMKQTDAQTDLPATTVDSVSCLSPQNYRAISRAVLDTTEVRTAQNRVMYQ